jgi:hypothetical protein
MNKINSLTINHYPLIDYNQLVMVDHIASTTT